MVGQEKKTRFYQKTLAGRVALIAILAATAIGGNYALAGVPNLELSSVVVFLSGFLFGTIIGVMVGFISMTIYQIWNPWGPFILPIGLGVILCTIFIGLIGGILGRNYHPNSDSDTKWFFLAFTFGLFLTLFYDLVTNFAYSLTFGVPYLVTLITGAPFMLIHVISNGILFGFLTQPVSLAVEHLHFRWHSRKEEFTPKTNNQS